METNSEEIHNLETLLQQIQQFITQSRTEPKDPIDVLVLLESLQIDYPVEYYRYKLFQLIPSLMKPALLQQFSNWDPLQVVLLFPCDH